MRRMSKKWKNTIRDYAAACHSFLTPKTANIFVAQLIMKNLKVGLEIRIQFIFYNPKPENIIARNSIKFGGFSENLQVVPSQMPPCSLHLSAGSGNISGSLNSP